MQSRRSYAAGGRVGVPPATPPVAALVGRERELAAFEERLDDAARGEGSVTFLSGEPGIGKSRLLREFAGRAAARGWQVLKGRAYDTEGMPPYLPFAEALRDYIGRCPDGALAALISGAPEICRLLPEVRDRVPGLPEPATMGPEMDRFRLWESVATLLAGIARTTESRGLVLALDDLHWADRPTLQLFAHIARKVPGTPILVAGAYRTTELDGRHPLLGLLGELTRERLCRELALPALSEPQTATLIANLAGAAVSPALVQSVHQQTAGNPFFIEEVARHLLEQGHALGDDSAATLRTTPEGVRHVLGERLGRLDATVKDALEAAAVLGEAFAFDLLSATSELDAATLTRAVEAAERAGMLRQEGDGYVFSHALVRRAIGDALSVPRRLLLNLRAAEAMESLYGERSDATLAAAAHHWRLAGRLERATEYFLKAGEKAIALTAWEETVRHWEAALECMENTGVGPARRARLLEGLGDVHFLASLEAHPCVECYERASALYEEAGDPAGAARARSRAGRSLAYPTSGFDYAAALGHLRAAEKVLSAQPPGAELGELYAAIAHAETHALRSGPEQMVEAMRRLEEVSAKIENEFLHDFLRVQSYHLRGHYLGLLGQLAEGLALEELACEMATALRDKTGAVNEWPARWHEFLLAYSSEDGRPTPNEVGSYQFSRVHSRFGLSNFIANCCGWQSLDLLDPVRARAKHERCLDGQGRFVTPFLHYDLVLSGDVNALRQLVEAGTSAISNINPDAMSVARSTLDWAEGRWETALAFALERSGRWRREGTQGVLAFADRWYLRTARVVGDVVTAESAAAETLSIALAGGAVKYELAARAELALLLAEEGRPDEAEAHLRRCREILALGEDWRGLGGRVSLAEAVLAAAQGDNARAGLHFAAAIECFRELSLPWDEAETFECWATVGRRFHRGRSRQAFIAEKIDCARGLYARIEAGQPWLDRLDALERRLAGAPTPTAAGALPDGLTAREAEVLGLIAGGLSSREIGRELVLSVRTVERHIANVYLKTNTHGRAQATSYALAHGLGPKEQ